MLGSHSQLASPASERSIIEATTAASSKSLIRAPNSSTAASAESGTFRTATSPVELPIPKRESFVETGFLETLKPQFKAGFSLTTPLSSTAASSATGSVSGSGNILSAEEKLNAVQQQQLSDELKAQIRDLTEKLDTLKQRRSEDKERLREFDKMKTQFEQLQEFKTKIMDAQSQLQRDLQRARQETKDAIEARNQHAEEMSELAENVEMITLDKEMAEEKADTLQLELEASREHCEELQLDLEILKAEMQTRNSGEASGDKCSPSSIGENVSVSTFEFKQMEQQNVRLRDTLVRMRDLSAHEKHEIQKIVKELETSKSEAQELHRTKEKLSAKVCVLHSGTSLLMSVHLCNNFFLATRSMNSNRRSSIYRNKSMPHSVPKKW